MEAQKEHNYPTKWINYASLFFCLASFGLLFYFLNELPNQVPIHFSISGEADNFASKNMLWFVPVVQTGLVAFFFVIKKMNPDKVNYPVKINARNKKIQHALMLYMMAWMGLIVSFYFFLIFWQTLELAVGHLKTLDPTIIFLMIGSVFGLIIWYYIKARKHK